MNTDTGELREFLMKEIPVADRKAAMDEELERLNRAERRAQDRENKVGPWVAVSPEVAAIVKAGHAAMKAKKARRKAAAAARKRNRV